MDAQNLDLAARLVSSRYIKAGEQALATRRSQIKGLLSQRRMPEEGWDDLTIEAFLQVQQLCHSRPRASSGPKRPCVQDVALLDSNNFPHSVGVGEREARVASALVARRHYSLAHGIGRSGNISAEQPKVTFTLSHTLSQHALLRDS